MTNTNYVLNSRKEAVPEPDAVKFSVWYGMALRQGKLRVGMTVVGDTYVSTVFTGIDCNFKAWSWDNDPGTAPVLWSSTIFDRDKTVDETRCSGSREDAKRMHRKMVETAKARFPSFWARLRARLRSFLHDAIH